MFVILLESALVAAPEVQSFAANTLVRSDNSSILLGESVGGGGSAWVLIGAGLLLLIVVRRLRGSA